MSPSIPFADSNNPAVRWPISTEHANEPAAAAEEQECKVSMERAGMATNMALVHCKNTNECRKQWGQTPKHRITSSLRR